MEEAFGCPMTTEGQGGSIPLCNVLAETYPDAEIMLLGVEEPKCLIHAPNESVRPIRDRAHRARRGALPAKNATRQASGDDTSAPVHGRGLRKRDATSSRAGRGGRPDRRPCDTGARSRLLAGYAVAITERLTVLIVQRTRAAMVLPSWSDRREAAPSAGTIELTTGLTVSDLYAATAPLLDAFGSYAISDSAWALQSARRPAGNARHALGGDDERAADAARDQGRGRAGAAGGRGRSGRRDPGGARQSAIRWAA